MLVRFKNGEAHVFIIRTLYHSIRNRNRDQSPLNGEIDGYVPHTRYTMHIIYKS
jgi:hypothetical protein